MKDLNFKETSEKYRNEMMKLYGAKFKMDNIKKEEPDSEIKTEYNEKLKIIKKLRKFLMNRKMKILKKNILLRKSPYLCNWTAQAHVPRLKQL